MSRISSNYKRSTVYALIGGTFHFLVVVVPLVLIDELDGGLDKGFAFIIELEGELHESCLGKI
ncbi:hypothetical protein [Candidatus Nitrospira salsa]